MKWSGQELEQVYYQIDLVQEQLQVARRLRHPELINQLAKELYALLAERDRLEAAPIGVKKENETVS